ncbi:NUDIX hydrolase [Candidatus Bathyarchaeota archaeon]|nr:NUDIX hydrolase [Candidatus Bathyarchaeota archaeon]
MGREYPSHPLVGVGILIKHGEKHLLIRRAAEPDRGLWTIPGGLVEVGERVREAAVREAREETGLEVEVREVLDVIDKIVRDEEGRVKYHFIIVDFLAVPKGGRMRASSDALEARWVRREEFKRYPLTETFKLLLERVSLWEEES